jgi:DNA-directed RNA polymerase beta subunit
MTPTPAAAPVPSPAAAPAPVAAAAPAQNWRMIGDVAATRQAIFDNVLEEARRLKPVANPRHTLRLADPAYEGPEGFTAAERKRAELEGRTLARRLRGTWELVDNATGAVVGSRRTTVAEVPWMAPDGVFVLNGTPYGMAAAQSRLRPGVYTRRRNSGELESHVNVAGGLGHKLTLDPETGVFRAEFGNAQIPLLSVLKALGAKDADVQAAWGRDLWAANAKAANDPRVAKKLYEKLTRDKNYPGDEPAGEKIREAFARMRIEPDVAKRTLGQPIGQIDASAVLAATRKLLAVRKGAAEEDDRDAMAFQRVYGPEDVFAERLRKGLGDLRRRFWRASLAGDVGKIPAGVLTRTVHGAILDTGLGQVLEMVNPGELLDQRFRTTRMGEGGIPSVDSIPDSARDVQASHLGYIDPVQVPECYSADTEVMTARGPQRWPNVRPDDRLACRVDGRVEFRPAEKLLAYPYAGPAYRLNAETSFLVTPEHRLRVAVDGGDWREVTAAEAFAGHRLSKQGEYAAFALDGFVPAVAAAGPADPPGLPAGGDPEAYARLLGLALVAGRIVTGGVAFDARPDWFPVAVAAAGLALARTGKTARVVGDGFRQALRAAHRNGGCLYALALGPAGPRAACWAAMAEAAAPSRRGAAAVVPRGALRAVELLAFACGVPFRTATAAAGGAKAAVIPLPRDRHQVSRREVARVRYEGRVFCARVPGGLLYVRRRHGAWHWSGNSLRIGVDGRLAVETRKDKDGRLLARYKDARTGAEAWLSPEDVADEAVAFPNELASGKPFVRVIKGGKLDFVARKDARYEFPRMTEAFGPMANLVPFKAASKAQRVSMGARMLTQALPLKGAEAPLVQAGHPDGGSFEERYGADFGALKADAAGVVTEVGPGFVKVKDARGKVRAYDLDDNRPGARKTIFHQTPLVKPGDPVEPGQLIARSNFTDDRGQVAVGLNARVAYVPLGSNFEDATVISESFAKRLTSEHAYRHGLDRSDDLKVGRAAFASIFPAKYDRRVLANFDDDGLIRPGTEVHHGDPLILAVEQVSAGPRLGRRKFSFRDATVTWEHHAPGVVTDVVRTKKGLNVVVKSAAAAEVGDKLAGRYGDKGVIAEIRPDHRMPHDAQGRPFEIVANPLGVISRCYDEETEFLTARGWVHGRDVRDDDPLVCFHPWSGGLHVMAQLAPFHRARYRGTMLRYRNKLMDFCVTPNHRMWSRCGYAGAPWQEVTAERIYGKEWLVPVAGTHPVPGTETPFVLPHVEYRPKDTNSDKSEIVIAAGDWAEFLGWYLAEGNVDTRTHISQCRTVNREKWERIAALLDRLPFTWHYTAKNKQFHISSIRLAAYLRRFGLSDAKYVPDWAFSQPPHVRQRLIDAYWAGDGGVHLYDDGRVASGAGSVSRRLADDVQRLLVYQGVSANVYDVKVRTEAGHKPAWRAARHFRKERVLTRDGWSRVPYDGQIYCPTVPTGYIVTRRHGKILIAGNTNASQAIEAALGKIAALTGEPYRVPDFSDIKDLREFAEAELRKHGLEAEEAVVDPDTGRPLEAKPLTGVRYFMKLHHTAEGKLQGRGLGSYTSDDMPAKGGSDGSKRWGMLNTYALLSHGAYSVLRDAHLVRGQRNEEYWRRVASGHEPPPPKVPFVYQKFVEHLRAAGIDPVRRGDRTKLVALTDARIDELAGDRELRNADTVDWKTDRLEPVKGGLFDPTLTGGHGGSRYAKITLTEPMPSPVMAEPIMRVLGLTRQKYRDVLGGKEELHGKRGPAAIVAALDAVDLKHEIARARADIDSGRKTRRDAAVRRLVFLKGAEASGLHPRDWVLKKVPVLPPAFRPVSLMKGSGTPLVPGVNDLYQVVFESNKALESLTGQIDDLSEERLALYDGIAALQGLDEPRQPKLVERKVKGLLRTVLGSGPKSSVIHRKLLGTQADLVGRAVITPDPDLDMDEVGVPEDQAWAMYAPFVTRRLARRGMPPVRAAEAVKERSEVARRELLAEMGERPVVVDRAPVLHRYGMMGFTPKLTAGNTLRLPLLVYKGFGADNDGDAVQIHVAATREAVSDARRMFPSRHLKSAANFDVHQLPSQEYVAGLWAASAGVDEKTPPRTFRTAADALEALRRGEISRRQRVEILEGRQ